MIERPGDVNHKGRPLTVLGPKLKPGDKAPDFELANGLFSLETITLADTPGNLVNKSFTSRRLASKLNQKARW